MEFRLPIQKLNGMNTLALIHKNKVILIEMQSLLGLLALLAFIAFATRVLPVGRIFPLDFTCQQDFILDKDFYLSTDSVVPLVLLPFCLTIDVQTPGLLGDTTELY